jgi:carbamoyl-phosphate synthase/aspartate carbamoyltransferase
MATFYSPIYPESPTKNKGLISIYDVTSSQVIEIFEKARELKATPSERLRTLLPNKILISLFYEPSTRTSTSFQSAMIRLGGNVIQITEKHSSVEKGESLEDTIKTVAHYGDFIVIRHPLKGSAQIAANTISKLRTSGSHTTIINGGDGTGEHPTQALIDLFTIVEELTLRGIRIDLKPLSRSETITIPIRIVFAGDLKNGRTVHSLVFLLSLFPHIFDVVYLPTASSLSMPAEVVADLESKGLKQSLSASLSTVLGEAQVLYMTRVQKERFESEEEYTNSITEQVCIDGNTLNQLRKDAIIMHPLPRLCEISPEVDKDDRAVYFNQVENGVYVRMAILLS